MNKSLYYIECTCIKDCIYRNVEFHIGDEVSVIDSELHLINLDEENLCSLDIKTGDTIIILDLNNINVIVGAKYYIYTSTYEHIKSLDCIGIPGDYYKESTFGINHKYIKYIKYF